MANNVLGSQQGGGFDFGKALGWGGIGSGLYSLFGGGKNPYDEAMPYANQIESGASKYMQPYMDKGMDALNALIGQYGGLINDPGGMLNKIGAGYQQSPGFQFSLNEAMRQMQNSAASGGQAGSPSTQAMMGQRAMGMANQDYGNYLDRATGMYNQGLGIAGNINNQGFNASNQMVQALLQQLASQAQLAGQSANYNNQSTGMGIGDIIGGIAGFL